MGLKRGMIPCASCALCTVNTFLVSHVLVQSSERIAELTSGQRFYPSDDSSGAHMKQDLCLGLELHCAESVPSLLLAST